MRHAVVAATATVLFGAGVLTGGGTAVTDDSASSGPVLAFVGDDGGRGQALFGLDTGTGRQWGIAAGFTHDPSWSPTGTRIAWISFDDDYLGHVQVANVDGSAVTPLESEGDSRALTWGPDGTLAWFHRSTWNPTDCTTDDRLTRVDVVLQAPDGARRVLGTASPVSDGLEFSPDGRTLTWRESGGDDPCVQAPTRLVVADVTTGEQRVVAGAEGTRGTAFSPDSSTIAATRDDEEGGDVVLVDVARGTARRVATPGVGETLPRFVPDGSQLVVVRTAGGAQHYAVVGLDGSPVRDLAPTPGRVEDVVVSPDGAALFAAVSAVAPVGSDRGTAEPGVWRQPLDGSPATRLTDGLPGRELAAAATSAAAPLVPRHARRSR